MVEWHKKITFDGIWLDMNEVSSFCTGSCGSRRFATRSSAAAIDTSDNGSHGPPSSKELPAKAGSPSGDGAGYRGGRRNLNNPPYAINNHQGELAAKAVSPNATHHGDTVEYDFHNLFGHQIINATYQGLLEVFPGKRPFIIGRSTFASSGRWAGHWGGDNYARWPYLYFSVPQILSFTLFGMPMTGVDACGFAWDTEPELCARWMQLAAFFPFYR